MAIRLIYHNCGELRDTSPFDAAIVAIAKGHDLRIACPYLNVDYLGMVTKLSISWKLVTDIHEWLWSLSRHQQKLTVRFMVENSKSIRHIPKLHAKVVLGEKSALIGSANLTTAGIAERTEMAIVIEEEPELKELGSWFESLWDEAFELPSEKDINAFIESLPKRELLSPEKTKIFPEADQISPSLMKLAEPPPNSTYLPLKPPSEPVAEPQIKIVDAILGAYPYNKEGKWLSVKRQVDLLWMAYYAKLPDDQNAFLGMHGGTDRGDPPRGENGKAKHYTGDSRRVRMDKHVKNGMAVRGDGQTYMLAKGYTPADLGVTQDLVDALAAYKIIPRYDVNSSIYVGG